MMPTAIIQDQDHFPTVAAITQELAQEGLKGFGVEARSLGGDQDSLLCADRAEHAHVLAGGSMKQDGVDLFGRDPHPAASPVLLEMTLVLEPKVNLFLAGQEMEFF